MTKYLVTYHGMGSPDHADMETARAAFMTWLSEAGDVVVDPGAPLRPHGSVAAGEAEDVSGIAGYSILEADSVDAVREVLATHPFVGRGGTLAIHEAIAP
jgi:hypothetical protein